MAAVRWMRWLAMVMAAITVAQAASPSDPPSYYLLIDLSPRMAARQTATRRAVEDLVRTGIHGRMEDGEKLRIAFFDQSIHPTQATLEWDSRRASLLAASALEMFQGRQHTRTGSVERVVAGLRTLFPHTEKFTALILTDGFSAMAGTPFDREINQQMAENRSRFARANRPFLITLLARKGRWEAFGIHTDLEGKVELPAMPPESDAVEKALAALRQVTSGKTPEPESQKPVAEALPSKKVETPEPEPAAEPKKVEVAIAPPPVVEQPKPAPIIEPKVEPKIDPAPPPVVETKPEVKIEPEPAPPKVVAAVVKPEPQPISPAPVAVEEKKEGPKIEEAVSTAHVAPSVQTTVSTVAIATPPASFPWPVLLAGFGIIAAGGAVFYLRATRPKPKNPGSLISQSMDSKGRPPFK